MIRLNLKIAFRNIWKNRSSSLINIAGLTIGLSSCLLLLIYVVYEWRYDKCFPESEQIYQAMVNLQDERGELDRTIAYTPAVLAQTLKAEYPELQHVAKMTDAYPRLVALPDRKLKFSSRYADPELLDVMQYAFISGSRITALRDPHSIVLTAAAARRLFGTTDVLNRTVKFEGAINLQVSGVIRDLPANVTYPFESLVPWKLFTELNGWPARVNWGDHSFYTLIRLSRAVQPDLVNRKIGRIAVKHYAQAKEQLFLYPLTKLQLYGEFSHGKSVGGKIGQVKIFAGLALGILLIACINFVNLTTAYAQKRSREVGIKKTIGATRTGLVFQFLLESFLLTAGSVFLSIAVCELLLPGFNHLLDIDLSINYRQPYVWTGILLVNTVTVLAAGIYPAFYLSGIDPVLALKKPLNFRAGFTLNLRQMLVIVQFSSAIMLIACALTIHQQLQFLRNRPLGYQENALVEIPHEGQLYQKYEVLRTRLLASGAVTNITQASGSLSHKNASIRGLEWEQMQPGGKLIDFDQIYTTYDFMSTAGIPMLSGREFSRAYASDTAGVLLNSKAVALMNLKHPVGSTILFQGERRTVIGTFDRLIWGERNKSEAPLVIAFAPGISETITMRLNPARPLSSVIADISKIVSETNPDFPVNIQFLDVLNGAKFKDEIRLARLSDLFGGLAILISCLGLFGLSAFSAAQRTREIGIRKVLGANRNELMAMLSLSFLKLVCLAIVVALPIAHYVMAGWLGRFEIHTPLGLWVFLLTGVMTLLVALLTVSWQTYSAAGAEPVKALKYE